MSDKDKSEMETYVVPDAPFRPGDTADFGGKWEEKPGDLNRPDPITCKRLNSCTK